MSERGLQRLVERKQSPGERSAGDWAGAVSSRGGKTGRVGDRGRRRETDRPPSPEGATGAAARRKGRREGARCGVRSRTGPKSKRQGAGDDFRNFPGRVQPRMERTFGAITHQTRRRSTPRLSPFQSFGGFFIFCRSVFVRWIGQSQCKKLAVSLREADPPIHGLCSGVFSSGLDMNRSDTSLKP